VGQADQHHLGGLPGRRRGAGLAEALQENLPGPAQRRDAQLFGQRPAAHPLGLGHRGVLGDLRDQADAGQRMGQLQEVLQDHGRVGARGIEAGHEVQRLGDLAAHDGLEEVEDLGAVGQAQHVLDVVLAHRAARERDRLVEQRQAVAHRAVGGARNHGERPGRGLGPFPGGDVGEVGGQARLLDPAQVEALAARQHGDRDLADFRGGEDEDHVLRRLLQGLQQAVEGLPREHVDLVDDVDLGARRDRSVAHALDQLADVVDAGAAGRVHLDHVDVAVPGDGGAVLAGSAGLGAGAALAVRADAVEGAGEDARGRRLAHAAHAGEDVGLGDAPGRDRVAEGTDRGLLADQVGEAGRAVLAGEHPVGRRLGGLLGAGALRVLGQVRHESAAGSSVSPRGPV
jgi:hypothetical protein